MNGTNENAIVGLIYALITPIIILNFFAPVVGGIWLGFLGEWSAIGVGIAYMFMGVMIVSILIIPSILLGAPAILLIRKGHRFWGGILGIPSLAWTHLIIVGSGAFVLFYFREEAYRSDYLLPFLLWGGAVAVAPWTYLASKEPNSSPAHTSAFFFLTGVVAACVGILFFEVEALLEIATIIAVPMGLSFVLQLIQLAGSAVETHDPYNPTY